MAMEMKYLLPLLAIIGYSLLESYCVNAESSTTPWPELGARRRTQNQKQPTTVSPARDFVSQPSAWNKPLIPQIPETNPIQIPKKPSIPSQTRDYVNPNIQLSYPSNNGANNKPAVIQNQNPILPVSDPSHSRDYVNPNIQLTYSNAAGGSNNNKNPSSNNAAVQSTPTLSSGPPLRDYVNPKNSGTVSYANAVNNNQNTKATVGPTNGPQLSTTPATRFPGKHAGITNTQQSSTPNPKIRLDENSELQEFSEALLRKDTNNGFKYVKVNYQGKTRSNSLKDEAPDNLMTIDPAAYKIPTIEKLIALHNNYIVMSNQNEVYTAQERIEENNFLDAILSTSVMQHTRNFLISKGKISKDPKDFKDLLRTIWFNMYSRGGGKIGSSGFEHVYLAEIKNDAISGLHNWLYFNDEEKKNTANYLGYMKKLDFDKGAILKFHFNFQQIDKPVGSMFIGTSPEFELALYSTCFLVRPDDVCPLRLGGKNFVIRTYTYRYRGKNMIGSAFPEI